MLTRQQLQLWLMKTDCCFTAEPAGPQITVVIMVNQQFSYREIKSFTVNLEVQWPSPHKTIYLLQGVTKRTVNCCFIPTWSLTSLVLWTERAFDDLHKHLWKKTARFLWKNSVTWTETANLHRFTYAAASQSEQHRLQECWCGNQWNKWVFFRQIYFENIS